MSERHFKEFYNKNSRDIYRKFVYHLKKQLEGIGVKGKSVLEVGCGKGFVSLYIALFCGAKEIIALDESEGVGGEKGIINFLENAVKKFDIKNIKVVKSDIMKNQFEDDSFDIVIANNAIHHVVRTCRYISNDPITKNEWIALFRELMRLLKPNGTLILGEFSRKTIWRYIKLRYRQIDWELHPTLKEWLLVTELSGFKKISFRYTVPFKLRKLEPLLSNSFSSFFLNPAFNIYCEK